MKVAFHGKLLPILHNLVYVSFGTFRLQSQGITRKINYFPAIHLRKVKLLTVRPQRIRIIQLFCEGKGILEFHWVILIKNTTSLRNWWLSNRLSAGAFL